MHYLNHASIHPNAFVPWVHLGLVLSTQDIGEGIHIIIKTYEYRPSVDKEKIAEVARELSRGARLVTRAAILKMIRSAERGESK